MEKYRPDIDGLRAVAVISVVLFHAGVKALGGGYVGVDIFFVISGYLITRYIDQRIRAGKFSILEFYERRVRRIMPALLFLLLVASVLSLGALPDDLYNFAKSEIAAILFAPNILFFREAGYFDAAAKLKPLLHLWSLGVEEQFYICFPVTLLVASRWGRRGTLATVYICLLGSFTLGVWTVHDHPSAAFYLLPFRAWEPLVGAFVALGAPPRIHDVWFRNAVSVSGLGLIFLSFILYSPDTLFPGAAAAMPCLGAGLLLCGNEDGPTIVGSLLATRPMVFIGLISYSLYLWHWTLLVLGEQFLGRPMTAVETTWVVLSSVAAAAGSWKFVEQPFRKRVVGASRRTLFLQMAAVATCLVVVAGIGVAGHGLPGRFSVQVAQYAAGRTDRESELSSCTASLEHLQHGDVCHIGSAKSGKPDFILWGDSHAAAIAPAFRVLAKETGTAGWLVSHPGCAPLLGVTRVDRDISGCSEFNDAVISAIERYDIRVVWLVGRWDINASGRTSWELSQGQHQVFILDKESSKTSLSESRAVFERGLRRTLTRLQQGQRNVILLIDVPNTSMDTPGFLAWSASRGRIGRDARINIVSHDRESVEGFLLQLGKESHVTVLSPKQLLCHESNCLIATDGRSLYRDDHHLTVFGALQLVDLLRPTFLHLD